MRLGEYLFFGPVIQSLVYSDPVEGREERNTWFDGLCPCIRAILAVLPQAQRLLSHVRRPCRALVLCLLVLDFGGQSVVAVLRCRSHRRRSRLQRMILLPYHVLLFVLVVIVSLEVLLVRGAHCRMISIVEHSLRGRLEVDCGCWRRWAVAKSW